MIIPNEFDGQRLISDTWNPPKYLILSSRAKVNIFGKIDLYTSNSLS